MVDRGRPAQLLPDRLRYAWPGVERAVAAMDREQVVARIWAHDHTVWQPQPTEIVNRLGWLHIISDMTLEAPALQQWAFAVRAAGYTQALLMGMGGSSLAPQLFSAVFGAAGAGLPLAVLDSTDPGAVLAHAAQLDLARTLFIVSTKSGTTVETLSLFKFFYNRAVEAVGAEQAGERFVAIVDPGSFLAGLAERCGFHTTFLGHPDIGGRYSALSCFGLAPAALVGVDLRRLLDRAQETAAACGPEVAAADNPAVWLGAALGEMARAGRDKVTFALSPAIAPFGDWLEQLIAESTGKKSRGILPVIGEPLGSPAAYGDDRFFVHIRLGDDQTLDAPLAALEAAGHPLLRLHLRDPYDLGGQIFLWEMATAIAGHLLGINPFDQPDVEAAKEQARRMVEAYIAQGALPEAEAAPLNGATLAAFLAQAQPGSYVALQAYLPPTPETGAALTVLRLRLRDRYRLATTVGYGPRFLHSTGQLHKGDAGNGLFIQFTAASPRDVPIPDEPGAPDSSITFGVLESAQALGDRQALLEAGRRVIRFHLGQDALGGLKRLVEELA